MRPTHDAMILLAAKARRCPSALLVCMACLASSRSATAADTVPDWARYAVMDAKNADSRTSRVPAGYVRSEIETLLRPAGLLVNDTRVEVVRMLTVKPWQAQPGLGVAAMEVRGFRKSGNRSEDAGSVIPIAVFEGMSGPTLMLKASGIIELDARTRLESLDLAPYRIARETVALGIRTSKEILCTVDCAAGIGHNIYLNLFVVDGNRLRSIWSTLLASSNETIGPANDDGTRDITFHGKEDPAAVSVLKRSSHGYYDLRKSSGKRSRVYHWNGTQYASDEDDIVQDVNGE